MYRCDLCGPTGERKGQGGKGAHEEVAGAKLLDVVGIDLRTA